MVETRTKTSIKADTALMLLREEIDAIRADPSILARFNASTADFRALCHFCSESLNGKRSNSESVFITGSMFRILEHVGFTMRTQSGLYFVDWNA